MRTAKLFGKGLLSLSLVCWIVGCDAEEEQKPPSMPSPGAPSSTTAHGDDDGEGETHQHDEGEEGHGHDEDADPDIIEEDAEDEVIEGAEGDETAPAPETDGDAQASTDSLDELPEPIVTGVEETNLDLPVVEAGSGTDA